MVRKAKQEKKIKLMRDMTFEEFVAINAEVGIVDVPTLRNIFDNMADFVLVLPFDAQAIKRTSLAVLGTQIRCSFCEKPIDVEKDFRDSRSKSEFEISGLCQKCQDETYGE